MYLVLGQACFRDALILMSPRLYEKNHDAFPGRIARWASEADLVAAIDTVRPSVVVLASGYLLPVHDLLTTEAVGRLCAQARRHNAVVVTADPFLGLISQWSGRGLHRLISIDIPKNAGKRLVAIKRSADARLHKELLESERFLGPLHHLYPSYTDMDRLESADTDRRNLSFFNDALLLPPHLADTGRNAGSQPLVGADPRHWMVLISEVDFQTQAMFLGVVGFAEVVASLLAQTAALGRHAIFLGPTALVDVLTPMVPANERVHLLTFSSFRRVMSLLLTAECCFYWNAVSHTILMQLWNGRPVILFDRGHLARAVPAIYDRVIAWYYQGWEPPYLDQHATLSVAALQEALARHAERRTEIMARFRRAPSPERLMESLIERVLPTAPTGTHDCATST
jgi:hypothetical protein